MEKQRKQDRIRKAYPCHLKRIKLSLSDVIRLNVISAIIVIIVNTTPAIYRYNVLHRNPVLYEIMVVANSLYLISNPIIYISVVKKKRKEYRQIFGCKKRQGEVLSWEIKISETSDGVFLRRVTWSQPFTTSFINTAYLKVRKQDENEIKADWFKPP